MDSFAALTVPATHLSSTLPVDPLISTITSSIVGPNDKCTSVVYTQSCKLKDQASPSINSDVGVEALTNIPTCADYFTSGLVSAEPNVVNGTVDRSVSSSIVTKCSKHKETSPPHKILAVSHSNLPSATESLIDNCNLNSTQINTQILEPNFTSSAQTLHENAQLLPSSKLLVIPLEDVPVPSPRSDSLCNNSGLVGGSILNLHLCLRPVSEPSPEEVVKVMIDLQVTLKSSDKEDRHLLISQLINKEARLIARLLSTIEKCADPHLVGLSCEFIHDCLSPNTKGNIRRLLIESLVRHNAAEVLFRVFKNFPPSYFAKGDCKIIHGFHVIAKLASKEPKLAVKCRLVGGVKFTHQMIQANTKNNPLLHPLLLILKFIAKNPTNQVVLGKDGCVATLIALLNIVPKTHWVKIKLILENLALLTKTTSVSPRLAATFRAGGQKIQALLNCFFESNVIRLVRENGLVRLLIILDTWEKIEKRHEIKIIRALLNVLSNLCDSKHGRKAVCSLNGVDILHRFILACPTERRFEPLLDNCLNVFLKCASKGELPVTSRKGAITFQPPSRETSPNYKSGTHEVTPERDQESSDEDETMEDEEDLIFDLKGIGLATVCNPETTRIDDLVKMSIFFPELQNQHLGLSRKMVEVSNKDHEGNIDTNTYLNLSSHTRSLINFVKVAYPDMVEAEGPPFLEPLYENNAKVPRDKALRTVDRVLNTAVYQEKVVFDLDYLLESEQSHQLYAPNVIPDLKGLCNWDEKQVGKKDNSTSHLHFESRFESGNLRRAIQVAPFEYDLLLNADVNSWHHHQWFYFEISNMEAGVPYILNIINNEKSNSEFNFGMKPVIFSVKEAMSGNSSWVRIGSDICYHKNHYIRFPKSCENSKFRKTSGKSYYTATMTITFPHSSDVAYLAYHYPYTYTKLQTYLTSLDSTSLDSDIYYSNQKLCQTLNGNPVPLLTITSNTKKSQDKDIIFLTGRVHPGESNSSWVIHGTIEYLLGNSEEAQSLRNYFIFKIVPMLNPEGVIHGNQRCGLTDEDLNRRWRAPSPFHHPTIYYTKALIEHLTAIVGKRPRVFCDFHGHSRQKNVFMYGCSRQQSWWPADKDSTDIDDVTVLPRLAQRHMSTFSLRDCRFRVERNKESTARVAVWRQFNVTHSFTMEASTCGCDSGSYKNHHLSPKLLLETGEGFCKALYQFGCLAADNLTSSMTFDRESWIFTHDPSHGSTESVNEETDEFDSDAELDYDLYGICGSAY